VPARRRRVVFVFPIGRPCSRHVDLTGSAAQCPAAFDGWSDLLDAFRAGEGDDLIRDAVRPVDASQKTRHRPRISPRADSGSHRALT
jgi:hypothetical protein